MENFFCSVKSWQYRKNGIYSEIVAQKCFVKKLFLQISQDSQKNTCARVCFLIKLQVWAWCLRPATLLKNRLRHRCFLLNFAKFLRTCFVTEHLWWLFIFFVKWQFLQWLISLFIQLAVGILPSYLLFVDDSSFCECSNCFF